LFLQIYGCPRRDTTPVGNTHSDLLLKIRDDVYVAENCVDFIRELLEERAIIKASQFLKLQISVIIIFISSGK
jgi:hypothetical protein